MPLTRSSHQAFFRREKPALETPDCEVDIPDEVWEHFRDMKSVERRLGPAANLEAMVLDRPFENEPRTEYVAWAKKCLCEMAPGKVILLDPDTGMEPPSGGDRKRIKASEVELLCIEELEALSKLIPGCRLVTIEGAGHEVHSARHEQFLAVVEEFLAP